MLSILEKRYSVIIIYNIFSFKEKCTYKFSLFSSKKKKKNQINTDNEFKPNAAAYPILVVLYSTLRMGLQGSGFLPSLGCLPEIQKKNKLQFTPSDAFVYINHAAY